MDIAAGPEFDGKFAQSMLDDHKKDGAKTIDARDKTAAPSCRSSLPSWFLRYTSATERSVYAAGARTLTQASHRATADCASGRRSGSSASTAPPSAGS